MPSLGPAECQRIRIFTYFFPPSMIPDPTSCLLLQPLLCWCFMAPSRPRLQSQESQQQQGHIHSSQFPAADQGGHEGPRSRRRSSSAAILLLTMVIAASSGREEQQHRCKKRLQTPETHFNMAQQPKIQPGRARRENFSTRNIAQPGNSVSLEEVGRISVFLRFFFKIYLDKSPADLI